jgi:acetyltransferase EpsM
MVQRFKMNPSAPLIVYGAGGHGKVVVDIARQAGVAVALLLDDEVTTPEFAGVKVTNSQVIDWDGLGPFSFLVAIGDNACRERIFRQLCSRGGVPRTLVHPFSSLSPNARLGAAVSVCAGAVINPGASIGDNCIINTSASIDHDCVVEEHSHICPGVRLAGNVRVGARTMIGIGASVLPGIQIGEGCRVGAGAVVNRDLPPHVVAVGVPARIRRELHSEAT